MFWELRGDDASGTLITALSDGLNAANATRLTRF